MASWKKTPVLNILLAHWSQQHATWHCGLHRWLSHQESVLTGSTARQGGQLCTKTVVPTLPLSSLTMELVETVTQHSTVAGLAGHQSNRLRDPSVLLLVLVKKWNLGWPTLTGMQPCTALGCKHYSWSADLTTALCRQKPWGDGWERRWSVYGPFWTLQWHLVQNLKVKVKLSLSEVSPRLPVTWASSSASWKWNA